jgi:hypothetical protein
MTRRTKAYLKLIGDTDDKSLTLTKGFSKAAAELKNLDMAVYIPISSGGVWVALTAKGIEEYERLFKVAS